MVKVRKKYLITFFCRGIIKKKNLTFSGFKSVEKNPIRNHFYFYLSYKITGCKEIFKHHCWRTWIIDFKKQTISEIVDPCRENVFPNENKFAEFAKNYCDFNWNHEFFSLMRLRDLVFQHRTTHVGVV